VCRTAFALASKYKRAGEEAKYEKYLQKGISTATEIEGDVRDLGVIAANYDRFVQVSLR
jgi:hypothetical protein